MWEMLLSLPSLNSHKEKLKVFQSKRDFLNKNRKILQIIKLEAVSTPESLQIPVSAPKNI
ncbi:MAG: hypothetical protein C5B45_02525 [Chlamydiae bacterium]|nr:MAG: hypothetical protein C5B45_02525 [Chlamydiota bacterium]